MTNVKPQIKHYEVCLRMLQRSHSRPTSILSSQVISPPCKSVIHLEVANFCAAMDTLIDQDGLLVAVHTND